MATLTIGAWLLVLAAPRPSVAGDHRKYVVLAYPGTTYSAAPAAAAPMYAAAPVAAAPVATSSAYLVPVVATHSPHLWHKHFGYYRTTSAYYYAAAAPTATVAAAAPPATAAAPAPAQASYAAAPGYYVYYPGTPSATAGAPPSAGGVAGAPTLPGATAGASLGEAARKEIQEKLIKLNASYIEAKLTDDFRKSQIGNTARSLYAVKLSKTVESLSSAELTDADTLAASVAGGTVLPAGTPTSSTNGSSNTTTPSTTAAAPAATVAPYYLLAPRHSLFHH